MWGEGWEVQCQGKGEGQRKARQERKDTSKRWGIAELATALKEKHMVRHEEVSPGRSDLQPSEQPVW